MPNLKNAYTALGVFLGLLMLNACAPSTPASTPTFDLSPLRTEVAATVLAQVSQTQASQPSQTPIPSPTVTIPLAPTPTLTLELTPSLNPSVSLTPATPGAAANNRAQWVSQTIPDETVFAPGETFTMTWRMKNVGDSTWTIAYWVRFYSGNSFGTAKESPLGQVVPPGAEVNISLAMTAPTIPGEYRGDWVLANEARSNFKEPFYLKIRVVVPPTPTPTVTSTPSP